MYSSYLKSAVERRTVERIKQLGHDLAQELDMTFKADSQGNGFSLKRHCPDARFDENIFIRVDPQCYSNGKSSFSFSAYRISDEKLLKLIEFCKQLGI